MNIDYEEFKAMKAEYLIVIDMVSFYRHMLFVKLPKDGHIYTGKWDATLVSEEDAFVREDDNDVEESE